jgi:RNA polymerase sigma-70 factor (ECF subfamily)
MDSSLPEIDPGMAEAPYDPLLAGLAAGQDDAFAALYEREGRSLFRVAYSLLHSWADAEDAVQEVFVGLAQARGTLGSVGNFRAYLFTSLRHAAAKLAARRRDVVRESLLEDVTASVTEVRETGPSPRLERALAGLPPDRREVLTLKIDAGLTFREIAGVIGLSPNTVASRYRYALVELREALREDLDD